MTPFEGNFVARLKELTGSGPFTQFDGYRDTFPGDYFTRAAIYLDLDWALGEGFDYSVASSGTDGGHQRDFIFHVTKDTSTEKLLVAGSNNTNFTPKENLETGNHYEVTETGWYIFEHMFRNDGGQLAVDLNLLDMFGTLLFTETRTSAADTIPGEVGGNRYGWFTDITVLDGILVDATSLNIPTSAIPVPAALPLLATAIGVLGFAARRRRAAA